MALGAVIEAVVACRDVEASRAFHTRAFDLDVLDRVGEHCVLGVAGVDTGRLRLAPAPAHAARAPDPKLWDVGPRLLGMYSRDLDRSTRAIEAAGGHPRPAVSYPYGETRMRECVSLGSDGVWWTMPEAGAGHRPSPALEADPKRLHGELHSAVLVAADHDDALRFFVDGGGLTVLFDGEMNGEHVERMTGMPAGASLRISFLVAADQAPARVEVMSFTGVDAADLADRELGPRRLVCAADDVAATFDALCAYGGTPLGERVVRGPSGLEIELRESP